MKTGLTIICLFLLPSVCFSQLTINPQVQNATLDYGGSILLNISGGTAPYNVIWGDSTNATTKTDLLASEYSVTVTDAQNNSISQTFEIKSISEWKNIQGLDISNNVVTKANTTSWNGGAFSRNKLLQGDDGYVEHTITSIQNVYMIGISNKDLGVSHSTVDYQIYVNGSTASIRVGGVHVKTMSTVSIGDIVRIVKDGNTLKFQWNGVTKHQIINIPNKEYYVDFCARTIVGSFNLDLKTSFNYEIVPNETIHNISQANLLSGGIDLSNVKGGQPPYTYNWSDGTTQNQIGVTNSGNYIVTITDSQNDYTIASIPVNYETIWVDKVNVTVNQNQINKTSNNGWNGGIASMNVLNAGENGSLEFSPSTLNKRYMIGFSNRNINSSFSSIQYALYINNNQLQVYQSGSYRGALGTFIIGDKLKVKKEERKIFIEKNGAVLFTFDCDDRLSYIIDVSIYNIGQFDLDVKSSFGYPQPTTTTHYVQLNPNSRGAINSTGGATLNIKIPNTNDFTNYNYRIYDSSRTLILSGKLSDSNIISTPKGLNIPLSSLTLNNKYFLEVVEGNSEKRHLKFTYTN